MTDADEAMTEQPERTAEFVELQSPEQIAELVCAVALQHVERGETVAIHARDDALAGELDGALWTFRQNSFVPHVRLTEAEDPLLEPVLIFTGEPGDLQADVLVMTPEGDVPDWFAGFAQVYDFAPVYDEDLKQAARQRYAACKDAGYRMRFRKG